MKIIKDLVERISEEIEDAKHYAEKYVECKAKGNTGHANRFKEMANDELKHATYIHEFAVQEINEIKNVYTAPVDMQEKWNKAHAEFVEKVAWVKQMLAM
ncbi:MAG: hypothetical protein U0M06_13860 [Clostridia bacterium]|nr:hypothetical protein [Clostridia bacterium]